MKEYYTIGEISKIFDISIDKLRYYSSIGLITPKHIGKNNYRYYSIEQFEFISTVLFLRSINTPIEKIITLLNNEDIQHLQIELLNQEKILQEKINHLQQLKTTVAAFHNNSQNFNLNEITVSYLPKFYQISQNFNSDDIEINPNDVMKVYESIDSHWIVTSNIISTLSISSLLNRDFHTYSQYGLISEFSFNFDSPFMRILPESYYVCANVKIYKPNHSDIDVIYNNMLTFIEENNFMITGEAIERNLLDMYTGQNNETVHFIKIYIPIKRKDGC